MTQRQLKTGYFVLEGLNSFATVQYLYYFYFFTEKSFGFGTKGNLAAATLNGGLTAIGAFWGGKFAQRHGYHKALKVGFTVMMVSLAIGSQLSSAAGHLLVMGTMVLGMCLTWPTLEALVSEGEPPGRLERIIGMYNVVWAATGALAYFIGGAVMENKLFGLKGIFYVPAAIFFMEILLLLWLERGETASCKNGARLSQPQQGPPATEASQSSNVTKESLPAAAGTAALRSPGDPIPPPPRKWLQRGSVGQKAFVRMAWLANPFAYIAINSLVAIIPSLAAKLGLSATLAGFTCSTWCFARVAAFLGLWLWQGWHYRFRWLLLAYLALIAGFISVLLASNLLWLISAEIIFGLALGLIYYSSLFYSMDFSETKGEHGGIHEAVIGIGNFTGPAVGVIALQFLPQVPHSAALAVTLCLFGGLAGLLAMWQRARREDPKSE